MHTKMMDNVIPSENNPSIEKNKISFLKEIIVSFLVNFIFYWVGYIWFNWTFRIGDASGISILPQQGSNSIQFFLAPIGAIFSSIIFLIYRSLKKSGRSMAGFVILGIPAFLIVTLFAILFFFSCSGECGLGAGILFAVLFFFTIGVYTSIALTRLALSIVYKYSFGYATLVILFFVVLIVPIFYSFYVNTSFKSKVMDKNISINYVSLQKDKITEEEYQRIGKLPECCTVLGVEQTGTVILANLGTDEFLLQGPVIRSGEYYGEKKDQTSLLVKSKEGIMNITKGVSFSSFIDLPRKGYGTRPIFLSRNNGMVAFFQEFLDRGDFIVSKLDGGGIYIDNDFCPSWSCNIEWGSDGFIYLIQKDSYRSKSFYKVTPP